MNSDWLRYFVTLAATRNFHAAAEQLHITPQALSKAVSGLEHELKLVLIDRDHRVRGLTAAGEALLEEAKVIVRTLENAERRMAEWLVDEPQGPVTLAGDGLWNHYLLPPILAELVDRYPRLRPKLYEMLPVDVERRVLAGEVEVGLLLRPPTALDLDWLEGVATSYVIAGRPQDPRPWPELRYIVPRYFQRETPESMDGWPEGKYPRSIVAEVEFLETAIHLAEAGVGVAYLPELAVRDRIREGTLAVVSEPPCQFEDRLYVVWRKGVRLTPAVRAVIAGLEPAAAPAARPA